MASVMTKRQLQASIQRVYKSSYTLATKIFKINEILSLASEKVRDNVKSTPEYELYRELLKTRNELQRIKTLSRGKNRVELRYSVFKEMIKYCLASENLMVRAYGISLATGRREIEVLLLTEFTKGEEEGYVYAQYFAKKKGIEQSIQEIPCFISFEVLESNLKLIRSLVHASVVLEGSDIGEYTDKDKKSVSEKFKMSCSRAVEKVRKQFPKLAMDYFNSNNTDNGTRQMSFNSARDMYAAVACTTHKDPIFSDQAFVGIIMVHELDKGYSTASQSYGNFHVIED